MSNQGLIFGVSVLLLVLLEATKETGACCGGPTGELIYWYDFLSSSQGIFWKGCSEDDLYWKRRIAAMRKGMYHNLKVWVLVVDYCLNVFPSAKASSSSSVADAKKGEPVWGPPQELICYHCKRLYEGEPHASQSQLEISYIFAIPICLS